MMVSTMVSEALERLERPMRVRCEGQGRRLVSCSAVVVGAAVRLLVMLLMMVRPMARCDVVRSAATWLPGG